MEEGNANEPSSPKTAANGLRKTFTRSNLSRSTLSEQDDSAVSGQNSRTPSFDNLAREKSRSSTVGSGGGRGGSEQVAAPSGFAKLIPGARRRHRKKQEEAGFLGMNLEPGNDSELHGARSQHRLRDTDVGQRRRSLSDPGLNPTTGNSTESERLPNRSFPSVVISNSNAQNTRNENVAGGDSGSNPGLGDSERRQKLRRSNTARRLSGSFASSSRPSSPDRASEKSAGSKKAGKGFFRSARRASLSYKKSPKPAQDPPSVPNLPPPIITSAAPVTPPPPVNVPTTPTATNVVPQVLTTISPPTPTTEDSKPQLLPSAGIYESPEAMKPPPSGTVVSPSGDMISHRRVHSASAAHSSQQNVSNGAAGVTPLSPSTRDAKAPNARNLVGNQSPSSGFFSSMFSAAQSAASTLSSSLNAQTRMRNLTAPPDTDSPVPSTQADGPAEPIPEVPFGEKRQLAIDTLGSGDLDFSHLGIDTSTGGIIRTEDGVVFTKMEQGNRSRKSTISQRDAMSANLEDARAARAVSMAYEKPPDSATTGTTATLTEDRLAENRPLTPVARVLKGGAGDRTPPNWSIIESEVGENVKGSASLRNRHRRRRTSTGATASTIGAIGAAVGGMAIPGVPISAPRLTGFAIASKKRNRDFHQLFRSVPEDDYLIEDYSCALQREIILAGRIYISEGHICFSSNILGWVTTLVIGFDEVVAIEKESTAMVFPNAIAIKTLHARHIFRSLLSRDSTYDLMINIWKINHPTLKSSVNGTQIAQGTGDKTEKADESNGESLSASEEEDEVYDEDEDADFGERTDILDASVSSSERGEPTKLPVRRALTGPAATGNNQPATPAADGETKLKDKATSLSEAGATFPGPKTHAPTEFSDPSGYYDKLVADEIIPAPLGQVYSLVFGPASGSFMSKFLVEYQKVTELAFEDDKKGLTADNKTRTYSYIKPLNASIGPKQTKCISAELLDILDLDKAVLVTLTTQTPDVPNGNAFSVKTKYLLTWAQGNSTRFYMSSTVEWTGKSWIKGPIEKGANDGQLSFGTDLVKALKQAAAPRVRIAGSKGAAKGKSKRAGTDLSQTHAAATNATTKAINRQTQNWGLFEFLRRPFSPLVDTFQPLFSGNVAFGIICILLFMMWFRTPTSSSVGRPDASYSIASLNERMLAYEELWKREESDLWDWLEERVGLDGLEFPPSTTRSDDKTQSHQPMKMGKAHSQRPPSEKELESVLREEKMSEREIEDAIRVTNERLETLQRVIEKRKKERQETASGNQARGVT